MQELRKHTNFIAACNCCFFVRSEPAVGQWLALLGGRSQRQPAAGRCRQRSRQKATTKSGFGKRPEQEKGAANHHALTCCRLGRALHVRQILRKLRPIGDVALPNNSRILKLTTKHILVLVGIPITGSGIF